MENDTFGGAILAWVKSLRRAGHGMPGQRHGPVQGKLHPRRGAGIELPASLRHRLRQGRLHRHPERNVVESKDSVGGSLPLTAALPLCHARLDRAPPFRASLSSSPLLVAPPLKP